MTRELRYFEAINEATDLSMAGDPSVYLMGPGVPDPSGVFGTTLGLQDKYGEDRVMDIPTAENGMTGVAIGSAMIGMRPIMTHHRSEFALLAMEQIVNQAAKSQYVFGGTGIPLVIRMIVGRGWGQGPEHSQSLQAWFAHVPGLKVIMPTSPYDAKGLLISAIEDNNPVVSIEHRWLYNTFGEVPEGVYRVPIGKARVVREGNDITIVATSYMVLEAIKCAEALGEVGIDAEVVDVRTLRPLDMDTICESVAKTGYLIAADTGWRTGGFGGEIVAAVTERVFDSLKSAPRRIGLPDSPTPASSSLVRHYYPGAQDIVNAACEALGVSEAHLPTPKAGEGVPPDVPDPDFTGPF